LLTDKQANKQTEQKHNTNRGDEM